MKQERKQKQHSVAGRLVVAALLCLGAQPVMALSNSVTLTDESGSPQTARTYTIARYFANQEICAYPAPYSGGTALAYWQADVKNRWPADSQCASGYVKFALVSFETTLAANGSAKVEFRNDTRPCHLGDATTCAAGGLNKASMLAFDAGGGAGSWGGGMLLATGGVTQTASARTMLGSDHFRVLENGPLRTTVVIRESPDAVSGVKTRNTSIGFHCTANCTPPYDAATWSNDPTYYTMRPSFVVTFYTRWKRVEEDFILDNGWFDRLQDQRIGSLTLYTDGAEHTNSCYTAPAAFVIPARSRLFETCWTTAPPRTKTDLNRAYLTYSKMIPAYGLDLTVGEPAVDLELREFTTGNGGRLAGDQGETTTPAIAPHMGWGQWPDRGGPTGGGGQYIAPFPRWTVRYLATFDSRLYAVVLANAKAYMHAPFWYWESSPSTRFHTGYPDWAFGRSAGIESRPNLALGGAGPSTAFASYDYPTTPTGLNLTNPGAGVSGCTQGPDCMVAVQDSSSGTLQWYSQRASNTFNTWGQERAHAVEAFAAPYMITGKYAYLEALWAITNFELAFSAPGQPPDTVNKMRGRWGTKGLIFDADNLIRTTAWVMRNLGLAAVFSPDGTVESAYYNEKFANNVAFNEGRLNITNGAYPPSPNANCSTFDFNTETNLWRIGRCYYENNKSNPLNIGLEYEPLGSISGCDGCDLSRTWAFYSPWMGAYAVVVWAWEADLGLPTPALHKALATYHMHTFSDPASGDVPVQAVRYHRPSVVPQRTSYMPSWAALHAAEIETTTLSKAMGPSDTSMVVNAKSWLDGHDSANLDMNNESHIYMAAGAEMFLLGGASFTAQTVTATANNQVTIPNHRYDTGQLVRWYANRMDSGIAGNASCQYYSNANAKDNFCDFYVKAVDTDRLELYNDAALTNRVSLAGDSSGLQAVTSTFTIDQCNGAPCRGLMGTVAGSHPVGEIVRKLHLTVPPARANIPSISHGPYYTSAQATAVDYDISITTESGRKPVTALQSWNDINQAMPYQDRWGNNDNGCAGLDVSTCDNPTWGIKPRPRVRNVRLFPGEGGTQLIYTAPDGNGCKIGVSQSGYSSTDDAGDTPDGQSNLARSYILRDLTPGTTYHYRITCGPGGGSARAQGEFVAQPPL